MNLINIWACGAMETRLTTDQEIPGSTPGRLDIFFKIFFYIPFLFHMAFCLVLLLIVMLKHIDMVQFQINTRKLLQINLFKFQG